MNEQENNQDDIVKIKNSFTSMFKLINPNKKYNPVIVASFYHIVGAALLKFPITIKTLDIDMRFSFGCCITSGFGKEAINTVIKESANVIEKEVSSFTSLHEEQLIGKRWYDKKEEEWNEVRGYFADDFLIKDDALLFLNDKQFAAARNYFLTALNLWGKNTIKKKLTGNEFGLEYNAQCSFLYFIQPSEKIEIKNLASGLFRRAPTIRVDIEEEEAKSILDTRADQDYGQNNTEFFNFLRIIRNIRIEVYKPLSPELLKKINTTAKKYYSKDPLLATLFLTNQNNIIKFAYINALLRSWKGIPLGGIVELTVEEEDVKRAIDDYSLIYGGIQHFVNCNMKMMGNDMHPIKKEILKLLEEKECFSEERSSLQTKDIIKSIAEKLNKKEETISWHFYKLRDEGLIQSKQEGKHGGKVWIVTPTNT